MCKMICRSAAAFNWLKSYCPEFRVSSSKITIMKNPEDFYNQLITNIEESNKRIVLSSLYIGTGSLEKQLVAAIWARLERCPNMTVHILLDHNRARRLTAHTGESSITLLTPMLTRFSAASEGRVRVSLYQTPELRGWRRLVFRGRWAETVGVQHMKIYLTDNTLICSGANLSADYFTTRQDRYMMVAECGELADYCHSLVDATAHFSLHLSPTSAGCRVQPPSAGSYSEFARAARERLVSAARLPRDTPQAEGVSSISDTSRQSQTDTVIYPMIQNQVVGVSEEQRVTSRLLSEVAAGPAGGGRVCLTTGYFNLTREYQDLISHSARDGRLQYDVITAADTANSFYRAKGMAGYITIIYDYLVKLFVDRVCEQGLSERIRVHEYNRRGWTFHAKGLWYYPPQQSLPVLTLIGSPNFGYRSVYKDMELQFALVTSSHRLREALDEERRAVSEGHTTPRDAEYYHRKCATHWLTRGGAWWLNILLPFIRGYF